MPKKETQVAKEVTAEPKPKIIERWGATEESWMLGHEDERIVVDMRSPDLVLCGRLLGTDRYTITIEDEDTGKKILIYKHAIDFIND